MSSAQSSEGAFRRRDREEVRLSMAAEALKAGKRLNPA